MRNPELRNFSPRVIPPDPLAAAAGRSLDALVQRPTAGVEPDGQGLLVGGSSGPGRPPDERVERFVTDAQAGARAIGGGPAPDHGGRRPPDDGEPPVARDRDDSSENIWPANEPTVRIGRGIREQELAEQNVEFIWGSPEQYKAGGGRERVPSQPLPFDETYPSPDRAQGFREGIVTLMDAVIDARIDFSSELGQQIIGHIRGISREGQRMFWHDFTSRIRTYLETDPNSPIQAAEGQSESTRENPEGLHAADWPWLLKNGSFISRNEAITGGLLDSRGRTLIMSSQSRIVDVPVGNDGSGAGEESVAEGRGVDTPQTPEQRLEAYERSVEYNRRELNQCLEILKDYAAEQPGGRIDPRVYTEYILRNERNSALTRRLSERGGLSGDRMAGIESVAKFLADCQYTEQEIRDLGFDRIFSESSLALFQNSYFGRIVDEQQRVNTQGVARDYPGNLDFFGGDGTEIKDVPAEYLAWLNNWSSSPALRNWQAVGRYRTPFFEPRYSSPEYVAWSQKQQPDAEHNIFTSVNPQQEAERAHQQEAIDRAFNRTETTSLAAVQSGTLSHPDRSNLFMDVEILQEQAVDEERVVDLRSRITRALAVSDTDVRRSIAELVGDDFIRFSNQDSISDPPMRTIRNLAAANQFLRLARLYPEMDNYFQALDQIVRELSTNPDRGFTEADREIFADAVNIRQRVIDHLEEERWMDEMGWGDDLSPEQAVPPLPAAGSRGARTGQPSMDDESWMDEMGWGDEDKAREPEGPRRLIEIIRGPRSGFGLYLSDVRDEISSGAREPMTDTEIEIEALKRSWNVDDIRATAASEPSEESWMDEMGWGGVPRALAVRLAQTGAIDDSRFWGDVMDILNTDTTNEERVDEKFVLERALNTYEEQFNVARLESMRDLHRVIGYISYTETGGIRPEVRSDHARGYAAAVLEIGRVADETLSRIDSPECRRAIATEVFSELRLALISADNTGDYTDAERIAKAARNFGVDGVLDQLKATVDFVLTETQPSRVAANLQRSTDTEEAISSSLNTVVDTQSGRLNPGVDASAASAYARALLTIGGRAGEVFSVMAGNEDQSCAREAATEVFTQLRQALVEADKTNDYTDAERIAKAARNFGVDGVLDQLKATVDFVLEEQR